MAVMFLEHEIESLIQERKLLPPDWRSRIRLKSKRGHDEQHLDLAGDTGGEFRLILRQNKINALDFSVILAVRVPGSSQFFRLRRYNGKSQEHTNKIEGVKFYDFHIHVAKERYQEFGTREDAYAEPTDRYGDYHGVLRCLIDDANLVIPPELQSDLFEER